MKTYETRSIGELICGNPYVGRGIVAGKSGNGKKAVIAYFIMGRSENSRNRVFLERCGQVFIHPHDPSKLADPSLIIYSPIRSRGDQLIVTNGDQTDTIYEALSAGRTFEEALETRRFEPDAPNFTPRISALLTFAGQDFSYKMSILKSADPEGTACNRFTFAYEALAGVGHFIHTYAGDGNPLPTFTGEPERVAIPDDIDLFTGDLWGNLNAENRISLYVRLIDLATGGTENRIINKNGG